VNTERHSPLGQSLESADIINEDPMPRLGIVLPTRAILLQDHSNKDLSSIFRLAQKAEMSGLNSVWVGDSLIAKPRLEPLSTLAALAMETDRVKLGTAVLLAPLRHPIQLAQTAATVDFLSNGRLILGMGVGGAFNEPQKKEWSSIGVSPKERGRRMTEIVQICRQLWTKENTSFKGHHFYLENVSIEPKPINPLGIPMLLACHYATGSKIQYQRAAYFGDGVIGISDTPEQYKQALTKVEQYRAEQGYSRSRLKTAFYMTININRDKIMAWQEADTFIRRYYGQNFWAGKWGPFGPPEEITRRILEYFESGAQEIIVRFASMNPLDQIHSFIEQVVPAVKEMSKNIKHTNHDV